MKIAELLERHRLVGLDANVFIYLLETTGPLSEAAGAVIDQIDAGHLAGVFSELGVAEVLGGPARADDRALMERYCAEIDEVSNLALVPVSRDVAFDAAVLRARGRFTLTDAVHLATARAAGASAFITNDHRLPAADRPEIVYLDDLEADA